MNMHEATVLNLPYFYKVEDEDYETLVTDSPESFTYLPDGHPDDCSYLEPTDYSKIVILSTDAFTWLPKEKSFLTELSKFENPWTDFSKRAGGDMAYLFLRNPATDKTILFFLLQPEYAEPDFEGFTFVPTAEECRWNPELCGVQVRFATPSPEIETMHALTEYDA